MNKAHKIIEEIFAGIDIDRIQFNEKLANKEETIEYFKRRWDAYYGLEGEEHLKYDELKKFWLLMKIRILSELARDGDENAFDLLKKELEKNHNDIQHFGKEKKNDKQVLG